MNNYKYSKLNWLSSFIILCFLIIGMSVRSISQSTMQVVLLKDTSYTQYHNYYINKNRKRLEIVDKTTQDTIINSELKMVGMDDNNIHYYKDTFGNQISISKVHILIRTKDNLHLLIIYLSPI